MCVLASMRESEKKRMREREREISSDEYTTSWFLEVYLPTHVCCGVLSLSLSVRNRILIFFSRRLTLAYSVLNVVKQRNEYFIANLMTNRKKM